VDQDLIEGVIYLPENLFYNTPAAGLIILLNRAKAPDRAKHLLLVNASKDFRKGRTKNVLTDDASDRMVSTVTKWAETEGYSRIVSYDEILANDYNISPSRYVQQLAVADHRPFAEIASDMRRLDKMATVTSASVLDLLSRLESES
jgi:type I restriction enzyme M protein